MYHGGGKSYGGHQPYIRAFRGTPEAFHGKQRWSEHRSRPAVRSPKDFREHRRNRSPTKRDKVTWTQNHHHHRDINEEGHKRKRSSENDKRKSVKIQREDIAPKITSTRRGGSPIKFEEKNTRERKGAKLSGDEVNVKTTHTRHLAKTPKENSHTEHGAKTPKENSHTQHSTKTPKGIAAGVLSKSSKELRGKENSHTPHGTKLPKEIAEGKSSKSLNEAKVGNSERDNPTAVPLKEVNTIEISPVRGKSSNLEDELRLSDSDVSGTEEDSDIERAGEILEQHIGEISSPALSTESTSEEDESSSAPAKPVVPDKTLVVPSKSLAPEAPVFPDKAPTNTKKSTDLKTPGAIKNQLKENLKKLQGVIPLPPLVKFIPDPTVRKATRPILPPSKITPTNDQEKKQSNSSPTEAIKSRESIPSKHTASIASQSTAAKVASRAEVTFKEPTDEEISAALDQLPDLERALFIQQRLTWKFAVVRRMSPLTTQFTLKAVPKRKTAKFLLKK